ncbi:GNAT family N-acetyltransferase [Lacticaseibacillus zhaodongensis]|uniref:GNAT family N-acetyltransferase n=1 Tax=Lacticaseibacillus zhaodongensis TaxID=2668065 RepID=UPI0012D31864|nr:GNAT family N-acetyltransferase [Lacticaseibacillus zhaodongensis]
MIRYNFENGLTIHEIKALYGAVGFDEYLKNVAETAEGLANSTIMTARDDDRLVGLIRGVSDMHTILFIDDLLVLPEYSEDGVEEELLKQFTDYFKQIDRIVALGRTDNVTKLLKKAGFAANDAKGSSCLVRPRHLLEIKY